MRIVALIVAVACRGTGSSDGAAPAAWVPPVADAVDTGAAPPVGAAPRDYASCLAESDCAPGQACTSVPGFVGRYCADACDPSLPAEAAAAACDAPGAPGAVCLETGRCARTCGDPDSCAPGLDCQVLEGGAAVCAGDEAGGAGFFGTCTHPNEDGPDCPPASSCFGGSLIGVEDGVCLPWCDDGTCPPAPDDTEGTAGLCYDVGLDHPVCALVCSPGASVCPGGQVCLDLGFIGLCAPEGADF